MQDSTATQLSANGLACRRGDRLLFKGLSFDLQSGDALHVTGANGLGKTTLIRTLAGLTSAYAGEVSISGGIGLLDERVALDPEQPLGNALRFWQKIDACDDPKNALQALGIEQLLDVPVRYLSTGQRKRAGLAVLLNRNADIWLLDEPLSGLDSAAIVTVTDMIATHISNGGIALIASHQSVEIEKLQKLELSDYAPRSLEELP